MKHDQLKFTKGFRVSVGNANSQAAVMVLGAGDTEGGPDNRHRGADRWLIVTEGTGAATVNGRKLELKTGTIVLIEAGDRHEIRNTGRGLLKTVSIYLPPAYDNLITPSHPPFRHERQILLDSSMVLGGEDGTQQGSVPEGPEHV